MAASRAARCEIDLSAGTRSEPRNGPAGGKSTFTATPSPGDREAAPSCPGHREAEPPDELLGSPRRLLAGDPQGDHALAHVGCRVERHVGDVDTAAAQLE